MQKETFDGKVTWEHNKRSVTLTGLSREQVEQVLALLRASGVGTTWELLTHHHAPTIGVRLNQLWRGLNAWMAPLLLLAVLTPAAMTQDGGRTPNGAQSGMSGVRRTDKTVRALLGIQLKCLDDIARRRRAGDPAKAECPAFDAALKATPLSSLVRYDLAVKLSPADEEGLKYAILEAAYFGYQHASEKER